MSKVNEGDRIIIANRPQTASDIKSALYFPHYADLHGVVLKLFGEEASVLVDRSSLPDAVRARHEETERSERKRYLDRLSEEVRGRASDRERNFQLNYAVLVSVSDLLPESEGGTARRATEDDLTAAEAAFLAERAKKKSA
jgi:hypothetical protein